MMSMFSFLKVNTDFFLLEFVKSDSTYFEYFGQFPTMIHATFYFLKKNQEFASLRLQCKQGNTPVLMITG